MQPMQPKIDQEKPRPESQCKKCKYEKKFIRPFYALLFVRLLVRGCFVCLSEREGKGAFDVVREVGFVLLRS